MRGYKLHYTLITTYQHTRSSSLNCLPHFTRFHSTLAADERPMLPTVLPLSTGKEHLNLFTVITIEKNIQDIVLRLVHQLKLNEVSA